MLGVGTGPAGSGMAGSVVRFAQYFPLCRLGHPLSGFGAGTEQPQDGRIECFPLLLLLVTVCVLLDLLLELAFIEDIQDYRVTGLSVMISPTVPEEKKQVT